MMKKRTVLLILPLLLIAFFSLHAHELSLHAAQSSYSMTTIYARNAKGTITVSLHGKLSANTRLVVEDRREQLGYGELERNFYRPSDLPLSYGVHIENGSFRGAMHISFHVGTAYNGKTAYVKPDETHGEPKKLATCIVKKGEASFPLDRSAQQMQTQQPFIVVIQDGEKQNQTTAVRYIKDAKGHITASLQGSFSHGEPMQATRTLISTNAQTDTYQFVFHMKKLQPSDRMAAISFYLDQRYDGLPAEISQNNSHGENAWVIHGQASLSQAAAPALSDMQKNPVFTVLVPHQDAYVYAPGTTSTNHPAYQKKTIQFQLHDYHAALTTSLSSDAKLQILPLSTHSQAYAALQEAATHRKHPYAYEIKLDKGSIKGPCEITFTTPHSHTDFYLYYQDKPGREPKEIISNNNTLKISFAKPTAFLLAKDMPYQKESKSLSSFYYLCILCMAILLLALISFIGGILYHHYKKRQ